MGKKSIGQIVTKKPGVVSGKMFGYPAYYIQKKLFACVYEDGVGIKIPEDKLNDLIGAEGIIHFQPLGGRRCGSGFKLTGKNL